jgi:hypothetical protein
VKLGLALNSYSPCLSLPSAGIFGVHHNAGRTFSILISLVSLDQLEMSKARKWLMFTWGSANYSQWDSWGAKKGFYNFKV